MAAYRVRANRGVATDTPTAPPGPALRPVTVLAGLGTPDELHEELQDYLDKLIGRARVDSLNYHNSLALMEIADAFYTRALEIKMLIHKAEREGKVRNGRGSKDPYYLFRTGELDSFLEACKRSVETGSRRLSAAQYELESEIRGLNSVGRS